MSDDNQSRSASVKPDNLLKKLRQKRYKSPRIFVEVSAERIAESVARDSTHCMIAEGIKAAHPGFTGITVDLATVRFSDPANQVRYTYLTPRPAQEALIFFDQGIVPEPFSIDLRRAAIITRSGNWGGKKTKAPSSSTSSSSAPKLPPLGSARLQQEGSGSTIPTVIGGLPPRIGPLNGHAKGKNHGDNGALFAPGNIARRRRFGIKMLRY